ncbi:MAG: c-type cytochrome [Legionellaceae bacterium]|nr:c-type cytochrome [Legionellaceae bacterium]
MKKVISCILCLLAFVTNASPTGESTYKMSCRNCHSPELAKAINAPAAFDKAAWKTRFKLAKEEVKANPTRYKAPIDYLLYKVKTGKGLMHHGGLCNEANVENKNCSDEALTQAIRYMSQQ